MRPSPLLIPLLLLSASSALAGEEGEPPAPAPAPVPDRALPHHPGGIAWEKDFAAAREASRKDGRPVALYFTFDT